MAGSSTVLLIEVALLAPLALALLWRRVGRRLRPSRALAFRLISLAGIGLYLAAVAGIAKTYDPAAVIRTPLLQLVSIVSLASAGILLVNPDSPVRAHIKLWLAKHLFQHRYDYRAEWLRFAGTVGMQGSGAAPLEERAVRAMVEMVGASGGLLLLADGEGALGAASAWTWGTAPPAPAVDGSFGRTLERSGAIVDLDAARDSGDALAPGWMLAAPDAWALVPLIHAGRLVGAVLLRRPAVDRRLDWEDLDLLRVAAAHVASSLAEARGQEALAEAQRFDEFNRRFAFIMHDIKNLVSQLGLVARNAERHADNPEFRADMIATLHESTAKMNDMLAKLSRHRRAAPEAPRAIPLGGIAEAVASAKRRLHPVCVDGGDCVALADPGRLEQALAHLVQNAIDATAGNTPVWIRVARRGVEARIEILDHGAGMSSDFVRTRLFKPFASTKEGGFGIGAYEARALIGEMGGRLEVESREGEGTRFTIVLPLAVREEDRTHKLARAG